MKAHIAIVGSRDYPMPHQRIYGRLRVLMNDWPGVEFVVVTGGAKGPDSAAERAAEKLGLECVVFRPDWDGLGKRAGAVRNQLIVDTITMTPPDRLIAYWDLESKGTAITIRMALQAGVHVEVWDPQNQAAGSQAAQLLEGAVA